MSGNLLESPTENLSKIAAPDTAAADAPPDTADPTFDEYAEDYDAALAQGLSVTGESKEYFARGRVAWLAECLKSFDISTAGRSPQQNGRFDCVLDYGCGTGSATPFLLELLPVDRVLGVDVSQKSLEFAQRHYGSERASFQPIEQPAADRPCDLAFCNGVFHHIPLAQRAECMAYIFASLRSGGFFAFWENNPWNPGTRLVMRRCPFDREAITLSAPQARELARNAGFEIVDTDFLFIFPRALGFLRGLEPLVSALPLGAQYQVLCRRP